MKYFLHLFLALLLITLRAPAQHSSRAASAENLSGRCGFNPDYLESLQSPAIKYQLNENLNHSLQSESASTITCGRIRFTFVDILNHTGTGFDLPNTGTSYSQCLCNAATHFQDIFQMPAGDGSLIDIVVSQSWDVNNPAPVSSILAVGGPIFSTPDFVNNHPGFYGGNAYDHFTTGIDPDTTSVDGTITFNFAQSYFLCTDSFMCYHTDFNAVVLHELTHVFGWLSALTEDTNQYPISIFGNDRYSIYDKYFLYYGDIQTGNFIHITDTTNATINTLAPQNCLRDANLWYYGTPKYSLTSNQNFPVLTYSTAGSPVNNSISHPERDQFTFMWTANISPGFVPEHIMGAYINVGVKYYDYSNQELRALKYMGFTFTNQFDSLYSHIINNHHPFTKKTTIKRHWFSTFPIPATDRIDNAMGEVPADFTITNCDSILIDLTTDTAIIDIDSGDVRRIFPGSLYNIRGCGEGGNNHNRLNVISTSQGDKIMYKPRSNFVGRAQFGFYLFDGKEKGGFFVYTIDVDSCHVNGPELVQNGDFEEGMEICQLNTNIVCDNGILKRGRDLMYVPLHEAYLSDGMKYGSQDIIVKNSVGCDNVNGHFGIWFLSFNTPGSTYQAAANGGERYFANEQKHSYFTLYSPMENCSQYRLEFDFGIQSDSTLDIQIGFTDNPVPFGGTPVMVNSLSPLTYSQPQGSWTHKIIDFDYCDPMPAKYLVIKDLTMNFISYYYMLDNLSLLKTGTDCDPCISPVLTLEDDSIEITQNSDYINLKFTDSYNRIINIYNSLGKLLMNRITFDKDVILDKSRLGNGILLIRINGKRISNHKIFVTN